MLIKALIMIPEQKYIAVEKHRSEYPNPIHFFKGSKLLIGDKYEGDEGWNNWYFCTIPEHSGGWVPEQLIDRSEQSTYGVAKEDYSAKELNVNEGEQFQAITFLNGWVWCQRLSDNEIGWVPQNILKAI